MKNKEYFRLGFSHKKWISIILSLCLLFSMMPAASFYAEDEVTQSGGGSTENEGGPGEGSEDGLDELKLKFLYANSYGNEVKEEDGVYKVFSRDELISLLTDENSSSSQGQKEIEDYLIKSMGVPALTLDYPASWGQLRVEDSYGTVQDDSNTRKYLYDRVQKYDETNGFGELEAAVKEATLSFSNVDKKKKLRYETDRMPYGVYGMRLFKFKDDSSTEYDIINGEVEITYINGKGLKVQKKISPFFRNQNDTFLCFYEPEGILVDGERGYDGGVIIKYLKGGKTYYAYPADYHSGMRASLGIKRNETSNHEYAQIVDRFDYARAYHSFWPFDIRNVYLKSAEEEAILGARNKATSDGSLNYALIAADGKVIEGTSGSFEIKKDESQNFKIPYSKLVENLGARLFVEYDFGEAAPNSRYYELAELYSAEREKALISYEYDKNSAKNIALVEPKKALIKQGDEKLRLVHYDGGRLVKMKKGESISIPITIGDKVVKKASINLKALEEGAQEKTYALHLTPYSGWDFTQNKYLDVKFDKVDELEVAKPTYVNLSVEFEDGTKDYLVLFNVLRLPDDAKYETEEEIRNLLEENEPEMFTTEILGTELKNFRIGERLKGEKVFGFKLDDTNEDYSEAPVVDKRIVEALEKIKIDPTIKGIKTPFLFDVKKEGDEYILKGYIDIVKIKNLGWVQNSREREFLAYDEIYNKIKRTVLLRGTKALEDRPGILGYLEGRAVKEADGKLHYYWSDSRIVLNSEEFEEDLDQFKLFGRDFGLKMRGQSHIYLQINCGEKDTTRPFPFDYSVGRTIDLHVYPTYDSSALYSGLYEIATKLYGDIYFILNHSSSTARVDDKYLTVGDGYYYLFSGGLWASYLRRTLDEENNLTTLKSLTAPLWYTYPREAVSNAEEKGNDELAAGSSTRRILKDRKPADYIYTDTDLSLQHLNYKPTEDDEIHELETESEEEVLTADEPKNIGYYYDCDDMPTLLKSGEEGVDQDAMGLHVATHKGGRSLATWAYVSEDYKPDSTQDMEEKEKLEYEANQSEIKLMLYVPEEEEWMKPELITKNALADVNPKAAVYGKNAIVVWAQGEAEIEDMDEAREGIQPIFGLKKAKLLYSRYNVKEKKWSEPLVFWDAKDTGLDIVDYSLAMGEDNTALAVLTTTDGALHVLHVNADGTEVTEADTHIAEKARAITESEALDKTEVKEAKFTKVSLVHNGHSSYTLASYDWNNSRLHMFYMTNQGLIGDYRYHNLPLNTGGNFKLVRDSSTKAESDLTRPVLLWEASKLGGYGGIRAKEILASKLCVSASQKPLESNHIIVSEPVAVFSQKNMAYIVDFEALVMDGEEDADLIVAVVASKGKIENKKKYYAFLGTYELIQVASIFRNRFESYEAYNDYYENAINEKSLVRLKAKNKGYAPILSMRLGRNEAFDFSIPTHIMPNEDNIIYYEYQKQKKPSTLGVLNPNDDWIYDLKAYFSYQATTLGGKDELVHGIKMNTAEGDISVEVLGYRYNKETDEVELKVKVTNHSPYSFEKKRRVLLSVYKDLAGSKSILNQPLEITGNKFNGEVDAGGLYKYLKSRVVDLKFKSSGAPERIYLRAELNDEDVDGARFLYDRDGRNNVIRLDNLKYSEGAYSNEGEPGDEEIDYTLYLKEGRVYKNSDAPENAISGSYPGIASYDNFIVDGELITKWEFQNFNFKTSNKVAMIVDGTEGKNVLLFSGDSSIVSTYEGDEDSYGLQITGKRDDYVIRGSGQLTVKAGKTGGKSYGIYSPEMNSASFMNTLKVRALGGEGDGVSYGLYLAEDNHKLKFDDTVNVILSGKTGPYHNSKEEDLNNTLFKYRGSPDYNADTVSGALTYQDGKWMVDGEAALTLSITPANEPETLETPDATFMATGYDTGILSNLSAAWVYSLDNGENWKKLDTIEDSTLELKDLEATDTGEPGIQLKNPGDGEGIQDSDIQTILLKRQNKPEGVEVEACTTAGNNDGKLKGITAEMEYKAKEADEWTAGTGDDITDLKNGVYLVRTKCKDALLSSESIEVEIKAYEGGGDPGGNDPGGNDPGGNDPGGNDPGGNDPGGNDPGGNDPGGNDPGGNDPGDGDTTGSVDTGTTANDDYQEYNPDVTIQDNKTPTSPKEKTLEDKIKALIARIEAASKLKPKHFDDIIGHWARPYIEFIANLNVMQGYQNLFKPNDNMTRAQLITALGRVDDIDISKYVENAFSDVKDDAYYKNFVQWAKEGGIIKGNGDGKFAPENSITREELAVIFASYARYLGYDLKAQIKTGEEYSKTFTDEAKISSWAKNDVKLLQGVGLMIGQPDGSFNPQGNLTRAEGATVLERFIKLLVK